MKGRLNTASSQGQGSTFGEHHTAAVFELHGELGGIKPANNPGKTQLEMYCSQTLFPGSMQCNFTAYLQISCACTQFI